MSTVTIAEISDPRSQLVHRALKRTCGICHAHPKQPCRNTIQPGKPLPGRLIHIERATRPTRDREPVEKDGS